MVIFMFSPFGMVNPVKISNFFVLHFTFRVDFSFLSENDKFSRLCYLFFFSKKLIMLSTGYVVHKHCWKKTVFSYSVFYHEPYYVRLAILCRLRL